MFNSGHFGKILITIGIIFIITGALFYLGERVGIGRLPGDIYFKKGNVVFYFPFVTCILISIILSLVLFFFRK